MKPILLHYYLTNRCNARCGFCAIWSEHPKIDACKEDVLRNLEDARAAGCSFVDFTGGEPLLHPDLPAFLRRARALGYMTSVTTNCILFPERAREIAGLVDLLHFSLDADTEDLHDRLRGSSSYSRVLESIELSASLKLSPDILFTYTPENIQGFTGVYALARKHKLMIVLDPVFAIDGPDRLHPAIHAQALKFARLPGVYLNKAHIALRAAGGNHVRSPLCKAVSSTVVILPDNRMALPCYHHRSNLLPAGESLFNRIQGLERKEAQEREGRYTFCQGCHINCYFDPSFQYLSGRYKNLSLRSKFKYIITKYLLYRHHPPALWRIWARRPHIAGKSLKEVGDKD